MELPEQTLAANRVTPQDEFTLDLRRYWQILVRGRWLIIGLFLLSVAAVALYSFTVDPVYEAKAKLLVNQSTSSKSGDLSTLALNPLPTSGGKSDVENRIEVLLSQPVAERAKQKLLDDPEYVDARGKALLITAAGLKKRIAAKPVRNTDVIEVTAQGNTRREAQLIANAYVQAYLEEEQQQTKETISKVKQFLESQLEESKTRLEASERQVVEFQKKSGLELGTEGAAKNLADLTKSLAQVRVDLQSKQSALEAVHQRLEDLRQEFLTQEAATGDVDSLLLQIRNALTRILQIRLAIVDLEKQRAQALQEGDSAKAQELQDQILQKKQEMSQQGAPQFSLFGFLPQYEELIRQELQLTLDIGALENRLANMKENLDRQTKTYADDSLELIQIQRTLDVDKNTYLTLLDEYEKIRIAEAGEPSAVRLIQAAVEPEAPISPNKKLNLLLAALFGLTLGTGVSFLRAYLDNTLKTVKDLEEIGLMPLGTVFKIESPSSGSKGSHSERLKSHLLVSSEAQSPLFDAYMGIKTNLTFAALDHPLKSLVIASCLPDEGKTLTALNLGLVLARSGLKVLLIDTDLRDPVITRLFELDGKPGFTDLVLKGENLNGCIHAPYAGEQFYILPAGTSPPSAATLLSSEKVEQLLAMYEKEFDLVLMDTPPVLLAPDTAILGRKVDGVLLVVRANRTSREAIQQAHKQLEQGGIRVIGGLLNGVTPPSYGYGEYGYGYS